MAPSVLVALLLGLPWLGAAAVWVTGDSHPRARDGTAVGISVAAAALSIVLLPQATTATAVQLAAGGVFGDFTFVADGLALCMAAIAAVIGSLAIVFSLDYMRGQRGLARYYALVLIFIGGMDGLVLTGSLLLLLVFWEIVGLCSCALIAFHADEPLAVSGGIRALVITQLGGLGLLAGILVARTSLGNDQIGSLVSHGASLPQPVLAVVAYGFLLAAAAKSAQVPFHTWLPGAMEAPTPVSALIHAATMVNAGVYLLIRFSSAFQAVDGWRESIVVIGVLSALLGAVMALVSTDLKRILAYSTISQLGLLFYAVGINAIFAAQFHMLSHAIFKALLFLAAGAVIHLCGTRDLIRLGGLRVRMPLVATTFGLGALSLAGVPVLNGFWSKELILSHSAPAWAFFVMLVVAALTALYSARVTWRVFFSPYVPHVRVHDAPLAMRLALVPLAAGSLLSWLAASALGDLLAIGLPLEPGGVNPIIEVLTGPTTWVGILAIVVGFVAWWWRAALEPIVGRLALLRALALDDFGLLRVEHVLVRAAAAVATRLQATQTGRLSWNVAAMLVGLTVVLAALALGGSPG